MITRGKHEKAGSAPAGTGPPVGGPDFDGAWLKPVGYPGLGFGYDPGCCAYDACRCQEFVGQLDKRADREF